jgi:hypothetical protein
VEEEGRKERGMRHAEGGKEEGRKEKRETEGAAGD